MSFDICAEIFQLIEHRLALQRADIDIARPGAGDDERDDGRDVGDPLEPLVQAEQGLDEQVHPLVAIFVPATGHEINRAVQI